MTKSQGARPNNTAAAKAVRVRMAQLFQFECEASIPTALSRDGYNRTLGQCKTDRKAN